MTDQMIPANNQKTSAAPVERLVSRDIRPSDLTKVHEIETQCFAHSWTIPEFRMCLRMQSCFCVCLLDDDELATYAIADRQSRSWEILNFAVSPAYQHRGIGTQLMDRLKALLCPHRRTLLMRLSDGNKRGHLFLAGQGFRAVRVIDEPYDVTHDDGYLFRYVDCD